MTQDFDLSPRAIVFAVTFSLLMLATGCGGGGGGADDSAATVPSPPAASDGPGAGGGGNSPPPAPVPPPATAGLTLVLTAPTTAVTYLPSGDPAIGTSTQPLAVSGDLVLHSKAGPPIGDVRANDRQLHAHRLGIDANGDPGPGFTRTSLSSAMLVNPAEGSLSRNGRYASVRAAHRNVVSGGRPPYGSSIDFTHVIDLQTGANTFLPRAIDITGGLSGNPLYQGRVTDSGRVIGLRRDAARRWSLVEVGLDSHEFLVSAAADDVNPSSDAGPRIMDVSADGRRVLGRGWGVWSPSAASLSAAGVDYRSQSGLFLFDRSTRSVTALSSDPLLVVHSAFLSDSGDTIVALVSTEDRRRSWMVWRPGATAPVRHALPEVSSGSAEVRLVGLDMVQRRAILSVSTSGAMNVASQSIEDGSLRIEQAYGNLLLVATPACDDPRIRYIDGNARSLRAIAMHYSYPFGSTCGPYGMAVLRQ